MEIQVKKKKSINYIDNKKFYEAIKSHIHSCREADLNNDPHPKISNYIGKCFYDIAVHLATKGRYAGYSFKEDMISDGVENCIRYIRTFDPDISKNAFSYFTQTISNSFLHRINLERKQQYVKLKSMEGIILTSENFSVIDGEEFSVPTEMHDNMHRFVSDYEKSVAEKKMKIKKKKNSIQGIFESNENE